MNYNYLLTFIQINLNLTYFCLCLNRHLVQKSIYLCSTLPPTHGFVYVYTRHTLDTHARTYTPLRDGWFFYFFISQNDNETFDTFKLNAGIFARTTFATCVCVCVCICACITYPFRTTRSAHVNYYCHTVRPVHGVVRVCYTECVDNTRVKVAAVCTCNRICCV